MSLFPRFTSEVSPLFRLLDDYERIARASFNGASTGVHNFSPKFDVKEVTDAYELHGELPGIEQKNINIEWSDGNTLTISGRAEHRSQRGTPPKAIESGAQVEEREGSPQKDEHYQAPSVEDESAEGNQDAQTTSTTVAKAAPAEVSQSQPTAETSPQGRYWVAERSVGTFHRSFSFPARVDQDGVKASLKNGILSIVVPKAKRAEPRKIAVDIE